MNALIYIKQFLKYGTIITTGLLLLYRLFSRRKAKTIKKREKKISRFRLFFNNSKIEKFYFSEKATNTNFIKTEDKFEKMQKFVTKNEEHNDLKKPDQIFFKLFKNVSNLYCENKNPQSKKIKTKERAFGNEN